jgi:hypothetical protein
VPSPEHIFQRTRVVFAPDDKTGSNVSGQTGAGLPQQQDLLLENLQPPDVDQLTSHLTVHANALLGLATDGQIAASAEASQTPHSVRWETKSYLAPFAGGAPNKSEEPKIHQNQRTDSGPTGFWVFEFQGINWEEDLSENGKWLFWWLIGEQGDLDLLYQRAELDGRELEMAIQELDEFGLLDHSEPNLLRLAKTWIPYTQPE